MCVFMILTLTGRKIKQMGRIRFVNNMVTIALKNYSTDVRNLTMNKVNSTDFDNVTVTHIYLIGCEHLHFI